MKTMKEKPSIWDADPEYPVADWQFEVANDDTRLGYREWVENQKLINETS